MCKKTLKNAALVFLAGLLTLALGSAPFVYFAATDPLLYAKEHTRRPVAARLDPLVEELYVSKAIRDACLLGTPMEEMETAPLKKALQQQLAALVQAGIDLPVTEAPDTNKKSQKEEIVLLPQGPLPGKLTVQHSNLFVDDLPYEARFYLAPKTNTLLYLQLMWGFSQLIASSEPPAKEAQPETDHKTARLFCAYLGLDVVDDWAETPQGLTSQRAQMTIVCTRTDNSFVLSVEPNL